MELADLLDCLPKVAAVVEAVAGELATGASWNLLSQRAIWSAIIVATAAFIQSTLGFAAALFGLPLLLWAGNDLMESQVMIISAMLPQNIFSVWKLRKSIQWRDVVVPAAIRIAALPIGIAGLLMVLTWSAARINQFVGLLILLAIVLQALVGIEWKNARKPFWVITIFGGSGILQGISGMSGPPMVLWVHGQRYGMDRARAFLFAMYISNFIPQILMLWWRFGEPVFRSMFVGLLSLPLVLFSATLGLRLGSLLGDRWLRPLSYACLAGLALASLLEPWLRGTLYPWLRAFFVGSFYTGTFSVGIS